MTYRYFVSFEWAKGFTHGTGDCEITLYEPVNNYYMITKMKDKVHELIDDNDADITIVNYILFKDEYLKLLDNNFGKILLILIWIVCGICAIIRGGVEPLGIAGFLTVCYGIYSVALWLSDD